MNEKKFIYQTNYQYITSCKIDLSKFVNNFNKLIKIINILYDNLQKRQQLGYKQLNCYIYFINFNKQDYTLLKLLIKYCKFKYPNVFKFNIFLDDINQINIRIIYFLKKNQFNIKIICNDKQFQINNKQKCQNYKILFLLKIYSNNLYIQLNINNQNNIKFIYDYYLFFNIFQIKGLTFYFNIPFQNINIKKEFAQIYWHKLNALIRNQPTIYILEIDTIINYCLDIIDNNIYNYIIPEINQDYYIYFNKLLKTNLLSINLLEYNNILSRLFNSQTKECHKCQLNILCCNYFIKNICCFKDIHIENIILFLNQINNLKNKDNIILKIKQKKINLNMLL